MKLLISSVFLVASASAVCDLLQLGEFLLDQLPNVIGCGGRVVSKLTEGYVMEDFTAVLEIKDEFCVDTKPCYKLVTDTAEFLEKLEESHPECHEKFLKKIDGDIGRRFTELHDNPAVDSTYDLLRHYHDELCSIPCSSDDAACWTCEGANLIRQLNPKLSFCNAVPFCTEQADGSCGRDAGKSCAGGETLAVFESKLTVVKQHCSAKSLSAHRCEEECQEAVKDLSAAVEASVSEHGPLLGMDAADALVCFFDVAGRVSGSAMPASELSAMLPSFTGHPHDAIRDCGVDDDPEDAAARQQAAAVVLSDALKADISAQSHMYSGARGVVTLSPSFFLALGLAGVTATALA